MTEPAGPPILTNPMAIVVIVFGSHTGGVMEQLAGKVAVITGGGSGLGLAITRDMIAQLGGEVRLENAPGGGALAVVRLQRCRESEVYS